MSNILRPDDTMGAAPKPLNKPGFSDLRKAVLITLEMLDEYVRERMMEDTSSSGWPSHWGELRREMLQADNALRQFRP